MDTKSFEVMIHSQYAFDVCRKEVMDYEDCRQTENPLPKNPFDCRDKAKVVLGCYKQAEKIEPFCLNPFNDARECMFRADGNLYNCRESLNLYVNCQKDPVMFREFLDASTPKQLEAKSWNFLKYRGYYDKYL